MNVQINNPSEDKATSLLKEIGKCLGERYVCINPVIKSC